ncbi:OsmC family protein [Desulfospira joergensenii]|uniref:OsmC family protein n=1 Tax=Desulfospira joergensenii TaxID=53329 RepID=UPI0003B30EE0|nr:OsmC family protein [Desulfospira joergensenii]
MDQSVNVQVKVRQISATASEGNARGHIVVMDRPGAKGGENRGAMGGENLLMSLGGCFMSNLLAAGQARETELNGVVLEITGELGASPARFERVNMKIRSELEDRALMEKLVIIAERGCIVANTLKQGLEVGISLE